MYKKITLITIAITLLIASSALALGDLTAYTVGFNGSETLKDTFTLDETPWLFTELPHTGSNYIRSYWYHLDDPTDQFESHLWWDDATKRWDVLHSPDDSDSWDDVKRVGEWEIDVTGFYSPTESYHAIVNFTVTPEPLATALFLVGGAPIAISIYRKRKKYSKKLAI